MSVSPSRSALLEIEEAIPVITTYPQLINHDNFINDQQITNEYKQIPSWNTAGRPENPKVGTFGFNIQTNTIDFWSGGSWLKLRMKKL